MKITFFGSDAFSLQSLRALKNLRVKESLSSLALVTRRLKPSGRGHSKIVIPPVVAFANEHDIPWHEVESEADFINLPATDLAVAVSYGRLIPAEYLMRCPAGGLNVHPSILPAYRGAAPLQRAIIDRQRFTGVSVQTLHPTKFDRGRVLWYSAAIPLEARETTSSLAAKTALVGAEGLSHVLETWPPTDEDPTPPFSVKSSRAPKIHRSEYWLDLNKGWLESDAIGRALGKLTTVIGERRTNLANFVPVPQPIGTPGDLRLFGDALGIRVSDGWIGATAVTVSGRKCEPARAFWESNSITRLV